MDTTTVPKYVSIWTEQRNYVSLIWQRQFWRQWLRTRMVPPTWILIRTPRPVIPSIAGFRGSQPPVPPTAPIGPLPIFSTHNHHPAAGHMPCIVRSSRMGLPFVSMSNQMLRKCQSSTLRVNLASPTCTCPSGTGSSATSVIQRPALFLADKDPRTMFTSCSHTLTSGTPFKFKTVTPSEVCVNLNDFLPNPLPTLGRLVDVILPYFMRLSMEAQSCQDLAWKV